MTKMRFLWNPGVAEFFIVPPVPFAETGMPIIPMQWLGGTGHIYRHCGQLAFKGLRYY